MSCILRSRTQNPRPQLIAQEIEIPRPKTPEGPSPKAKAAAMSQDETLLGGPWVVISGVISRVTIVITQIRGRITLLITTHLQVGPQRLYPYKILRPWNPWSYRFYTI